MALERADPGDSEVQFLLGLIAIQEKDYTEAIRRFRRILIKEPGIARVRLELARAFFLAEDYDNADRQFRLARAGDLPPAAKANIDQYLAAIRQRRRWSYNLSVAAAPNSNINAGPSATTVSLYGLPFELSQETRKQSGLGGRIDGGGEWSPPITEALHLRLGSQFGGIVYPANGAFNDMTLAGYAGPHFISSRWDVSPLITGFQQWYGNHFYNQGIGASLQLIYYPASNFGFNGVVGAQYVNYGPPAGQSGPAVSGGLGFISTLSTETAISGSVSVARQDATLPAYAYTAAQVRFSYDRDLPYGWSISIQPSYAVLDYDQALAAFGVTRRDHLWVAQVAFLNRRLDLYGFTPKIAYIYTLNSSDITIYSFNSNQITIGLTRAF